MTVGLGQASTLAAGIARLDPVLFLELYLEYVGDFFGPAFYYAATTLLTIDFHPGADDKSGRVGVCNKQIAVKNLHNKY